jgi:mRNA interferase RelE/StbE
MAKYDIEVSARAEKQLSKLERRDQLRLLRVIQALGSEPRPAGCRKLSGYDDMYRLRSGIFRIIYSVEEHRVIVVILKLGQRRDVYR